MKQEIRGISLIVLVITIIIIIILAGAVILSLNNSNIIAKAKVAKESSDFTSIREALDLEKSNVSLEQGTFTSTNADVIRTKIPATYSSEISVTDEGTIIIKGVATGTTSKITDIPNAIEKLGAVYIPNGFVASTVAGEMSKEGGLVIYEGTVSNPDQTTVNQFVWVPVDNYSGFVRENFGTTEQRVWTGDFYAASYATKTNNMLEVEPIANYTATDATQLEVNAMYDSVKKYKGFYIARYEAASNTGIVISRKNKTAWSGIIWGSYGTDGNGLAGLVNGTGAVVESREMYPTNGSKGVVSTLIYGVQWDAVMRWYKASGINVQDSTGLGNYNTGAAINTGSNPAYKSKNIYDMAGNLQEWTMEAYGGGYRVVRGGHYYVNGSSSPFSYRLGRLVEPESSTSYYGFRPALYIK